MRHQESNATTYTHDLVQSLARQSMALSRRLAVALVLAAVVLSSAAPQARCQAASAPSPAPAAPKTITAILSKAGQFTKFLQLLQTTREAEQITNQLKGKSSNGGGLTVFAPPDSAFSALPAGTLNSLSDQQKTSLVQFHVVAAALPAAQLETVSNPLRTQAGDTGRGKYPLNLTADGTNVNFSTGVVNATLDAGTPLYAGDRLVVYQVSKVLLPWALYGPPVPAPAPSPAESKKKKKATPDAVADAPAAETTAAGTTTASAATRPRAGVGPAASSYVAVAAVAALWWAI